MFPPDWFLPYDAIIQFLTAAVALAVGLFAFRGHQWIKERTLLALSLAFMMLSIGLFVNSLTLTYAYLSGESLARNSTSLGLAGWGLWAYYIMSILAYSVLVYAYSSRLRHTTIALAAGGMMGKGNSAAGSAVLVAGPYLELVLIALLLIILVAQLAHLAVKRSRYSIIVSLSFLLLLASHILIMFGSIVEITYVLGRLLELGGFLALLGLLYGLRGAR